MISERHHGHRPNNPIQTGNQPSHRVRDHNDPACPFDLTGVPEIRAHHRVEPLGRLDDAAPEVIGHRDHVGAWHGILGITAPIDDAELRELVEQLLVAGHDGEPEELRRLSQPQRLQVRRLFDAHPIRPEDEIRDVAPSRVPHNVPSALASGEHAATDPR